VKQVTFNSEVSIGEFTCVKPEPRKQVARTQKKNLWRAQAIQIFTFCIWRRRFPFRHSASGASQRLRPRIRGTWEGKKNSSSMVEELLV